jgi:hypothetical protein
MQIPYNNLTDEEFVERVSGLFVGQLSEDEMRRLNECIRDGIARIAYEGTAGLLGLGKIRCKI